MKPHTGMRTKLDRRTMEEAFDLVGSEAVARGLQAEIAVFGGSCLVLASDMRAASGDVDAVFDPRLRTALYAIVDEVAREMRLPHDRMNEAVKRMAPPPGELPPPLLAQRGGGISEDEKIQFDRRDSLALMRVTKLDTKAKLRSLMERFYPVIMGMRSPQLAQRIELKMDDLLDDLHAAGAAPTPTWMPRRGGRDGP